MISTITFSSHGLIAALFVFAALRDIATRTVPNWVFIAILAFGIILQAAEARLLIAMSLGLIVFALAALTWQRGWLGGADVKLLGAAAVTVSPGSVGQLLVTIAVAGGALAILYLSLSGLVRRPAAGPRTGSLPRALKAELWRIHKRGPLPYATAIAAGCLFTLFPS